MIRLLFCLLLVPSAGWAQSGEYKGASEINELLHARIFESGESQMVLWLFGFPEPPYDFQQLMGYYDGSVIGSGQIINGTPNAFNMILWHTVMRHLSARLAEECSTILATTDTVKTHIVSSVRSLCAWPLPEAKNKDVYMSLFTDIGMFDLPYEEFEAWYAHFATSGTYDQMDSQTYITELMYALFMNPYFLLQR